MIGFKDCYRRIKIGVAYMPHRKKPCLVIQHGNTVCKYASFNDEYCARAFMDILADFMGYPKFDWNGDDIPIGLREDGWNE